MTAYATYTPFGTCNDCGYTFRFSSEAECCPECSEGKRRLADNVGKGKAPATVQVFPLVFVDANNTQVMLENATWTPYEHGRYADGQNGRLTGRVKSGGETNRLFHVISRRDLAGKDMQFDWAHLSKMWTDYGMECPTFHLTTCG